MQIYLETERVILRRFTPDDVDNLVALDSDPDVMRYLSGGIPTPRATIENDILPAFLRYYERGDRYGYWVAIERSTGDFLGWFHFRPESSGSPDEPELGYRLRKAAWGKGYGTEVSRALIRKGFTDFGVERVFASTYEDNLASRRVMEKVGMRLMRRFRMTPEELAAHGADQVVWEGEDVEYAITRAEWERQEEATLRRPNQ
ncbi:MAG TPA: GNAT family N-acetyltransferase [Thermomicrobiales bacterium]|jgi:RimJ/RimL family protein N-acetyltransferase